MRVASALRAAGASHPGLQRPVNEDRFHCDPAGGVFIVVDGVGGHAAGEKAADTAVSLLCARLERETGPVEDRIREAITIANNEIHRLASLRSEWSGMTCVLTAAVVENGSVVVGHVGDTRLYKVRSGRMDKITRDHSPVGEREDARELSETEAMRHPRRNEVYRDVGSEVHDPSDPEFIDVLRVPFEADAALLLCSDGLTDAISTSVIRAIIARYAGHPQEIARALIEAANQAGGRDNVTVVYAEGSQFAGQPDAAVTPLVQREHPTLLGASARERQPAPEVPLDERSERRRRWRTTAITALLAVVVAAAIALGMTGRWPSRLPSALPSLDSNRRLTVGPSDSIAEAIARAAPGALVVVEPGEYREYIRLKTGIRVVSRIPRGALIRLPGGASEAEAAVIAAGIEDAELSGFRIVGDAATPLGTGLLVRDASVRIIEVEITGAQSAAADFAGGSGASMIGAVIHDNPGAGLIVRAGATPRIGHNEFLRNGLSERAAGAIVIEAGALPELSGNVFHGVRPDALSGLPEAARAAAAKANWFLAPEDSRGRPRTTTPQRPIPR